MDYHEYWDKFYQEHIDIKPTYDDWLNKYLDIISKTKETILDLGCGDGNDTLYLLNKGYPVLSTDYSLIALEKVKKHIPNSKTMFVDLSKPLPFVDNSFDLIIADLSLHYFSLETTKKILKEIKRILVKDGYLLARVNSVFDINYGANQGLKIEENYFYVNGYNKRFFSIDDVNNLFSIIGEVTSSINKMNRYQKEKIVIEIKAKKID